MVMQLTVRDIPIQDVELLKAEAAAQSVSLNSLLRATIGEWAELLRRREALRAIMGEVDVRRDRIAKRVGGLLPDSADLIREDRGR